MWGWSNGLGLELGFGSVGVGSSVEGAYFWAEGWN